MHSFILSLNYICLKYDHDFSFILSSKKFDEKNTTKS
uniref:Uncharacterized protein n=1 Tax=Parascaris univalens TaxID=6257 RepID=A0A915C1C0_PARUN